jgi:peptide/nickel transport system substrate-binding protein
MKQKLLYIIPLTLFTGVVQASCPAVTVADNHGVPSGAYTQQYELSEFESLANCTLNFSSNPAMNSLNGKIRGNPELSANLSDRIPEEPLVVAPYDSIGKYGGTYNNLSNAPEAGTAGFMSVRHVNLVRYADDLQAIVPMVAKSWEWNNDYTQLTFSLRKGHKWSDGAPFTAEDVKYWYDNLALNPDVIAKPKDYTLVAGQRMEVEVIDAQTVRFNLPAPKPGLLAHFASSFAQGFQPKHFLSQWDPKLNPNADALAQAAGYENGLDVLSAYFGNSDWMDTPTPMLKTPNLVANLPKDTAPTLESHIYVTDTPDGRHLVANPYFFQVDTQGQQLPYINEQDEIYVPDNEVRILKLINGEVSFKSQTLQLAMAPILLEKQESGDYSVQLKPEIAAPTFTFNVTSDNLEKRKVFGDLRFREAMSLAMNRNEINEVAFFGQGVPQQYVGFSPSPDFVEEKWLSHMVDYDPTKANALLDEVGLKDVDGDGYRELPNGEKLILNLQFATQGIAGEVVELVGQHWSDVGVKTTVKEVTSDEFRSAQSSNKLDVGMWRKGLPLPIVQGNNAPFVPPFETYFFLRTGMLWAEYIDSNGTKGVKPPAYVYDMIDDINAFQSEPAGSAKSNEIGARLVENMTGNMLFIGTVLATGPIYHHNSLKNVTEFKTHSYEYYWNLPYRGTQWYLDN